MATLAVGITLGMIIGYPLEAHQHPLPRVGVFLLTTTWVGIVALGGKIAGGFGGRVGILGSGVAEGLLLMVMIFPATGG